MSFFIFCDYTKTCYIKGLFLVNLIHQDNLTAAESVETHDLQQCLKRKTARPEKRTPLYPMPCDSDMPCHCENLNLEQPKFLSALCNIIHDENCSFYPYCGYCQDYDVGGMLSSLIFHSKNRHQLIY